MYQVFWRFDRKPFRPTFTNEAWIEWEGGLAALHKLRYAVDERLPLGVLTGESGVGKSHLAAVLKARMQHRTGAWYTLPTCLPAEAEFLTWIADLLTEQPLGKQPVSVGFSLQRIQTRLQELQEMDMSAVLLLEGAHFLPQRGTLDALQQLLAIQSEANTLTVLLIGNGSLLSGLAEVPALEQQCSVKAWLPQLSAEQTLEYVKGQLEYAGTRKPIFTEEAVSELHRLSRGIPRLINRLADLALLVGYAENAQHIVPRHLAGVHEELLCAEI